MTARRPRAALLPNANNPRLLLRILQIISRGVRRPPAVAALLDIEVRTVHYYTQAGEWLGLVQGEGTLELTPQGLALIFSQDEDRRKIYAEAVWSNPFVCALMADQPTLGENAALPPLHEIADFVQRWDPELSPNTAWRRASAVRGLLEPAIPAQGDANGAQLALPLPPPDPPAVAPAADERAEAAETPSRYAAALRALLDEGELALPQLQALLDADGARAGLGPWIEVALRRGDAWRAEERLIASPAAVQRRAFAADGRLVALTDPLYRRHLAALLRPPADPAGRNETAQLARRFAAWDRLLFGQPLAPETVRGALDSAIPGRRLESLPVAAPQPPPPLPPPKPFLDSLDEGLLLLSFPRSLRQLSEGVSGLNARLLQLRQRPLSVRPPHLVDPRIASHGGLFHPGERPDKAIPDALTLRLRALACCPSIALLTAVLLLDRRQVLPLRLLHQGEDVTLWWEKRPLGGLIEVLEAFCRQQSWIVSRPPHGGLSASDLVDAGAHLRLVASVGERRVLEEGLFLRLQEDPEARTDYERLLLLEERLQGWLEGLGGESPLSLPPLPADLPAPILPGAPPRGASEDIGEGGKIIPFPG